MNLNKTALSRGPIQNIFVLVMLETVKAVLSGGGSDVVQGTYFQYINLPEKNEYNFGFERGNPDHHISRHEQGKDSNFKTSVKWSDKYGGSGEKYWEYNHIDKSEKHAKNTYSPEDNKQPYIGIYSSIEPFLEGTYETIPISHLPGSNLPNPIKGLDSSRLNYGGVHGSYSNIVSAYASANGHPVTDSYGILVGPYMSSNGYERQRQTVRNGAETYEIFDISLKKEARDRISFLKPQANPKPKWRQYSNHTQITSKNDKSFPQLHGFIDQYFANANIRLDNHQAVNGTNRDDAYDKEEDNSDYDDEDDSEYDYDDDEDEDDDEEDDDYETNDNDAKTHKSNEQQISKKRRDKRDEIKVVIT